MFSLHKLTIKSFAEGFRKKEFSALEMAQTYFAKIKSEDKKIGAYLSLNEEGAIKNAERVDVALAKGKPLGDLAGVPLAVKDNILIKNLPATAGSRILENYTASYDSGVIKNLKDAGVVILGKTNLDEFAMGSSTENSGFHITRNPHDLKRVPGGSSGGSAAAVASYMALAALGSDTGGSVRQPAALCGVVGLRPTYGAVSRSGLIAMASSLDQIGPIAKTVEDTAILFKALVGKDPLDSTNVDQKYGDDLLRPNLNELKKLTIGLPDEYFPKELDKEVKSAVEGAREVLKGLGIKFKRVTLPHTKYALPCYYVIVPAEVGANLARFDGIRYARDPKLQMHTNVSNKTGLLNIYLKQRGEGFGVEVKRRVILGNFVLSSGYHDEYYNKAQQVRSMVRHDFEEAFHEVDVILSPTAPTPAFKIGEKVADPLDMYMADLFTIPCSLAGLPAISIPAGHVATDPEAYKNKLPIGFQLIGKPWRESDILGIGHYYEKMVAGV